MTDARFQIAVGSDKLDEACVLMAGLLVDEGWVNPKIMDKRGARWLGFNQWAQSLPAKGLLVVAWRYSAKVSKTGAVAMFVEAGAIRDEKCRQTLLKLMDKAFELEVNKLIEAKDKEEQTQ
jgi:hypothetical protein